MHAVFNPRQAGPEPNLLLDRSPGIAFAEFDRATHTIALSVWPRRQSTGPVEGWPIRIHQLDNGWSRTKYLLPEVTADGRRDFCVQVRREPSNEILYTLRIQGDRFTPPVDRAGSYSVRVFDPDANFDATHRALTAHERA